MIPPAMLKMMISNVTQDPDILAAVDLVMAPESKITFVEIPHKDPGKKCYHAIAEKDGRKVEGFLVL
jgi:hypothetical protein